MKTILVYICASMIYADFIVPTTSTTFTTFTERAASRKVGVFVFMENLIRHSFTQIPNDVINDKKLSTASRFLFVYLCSKPDNWKYRNKELCAAMICSEDSLRKYMGELKAAGWISKIQLKAEAGKFGSNDIVLHPYPKFSDTVVLPNPKKPDTEKTRIGKNPIHSNTELNNNTDLFKNNEPQLSLPHQIISYLNEKKGGRGFDTTDTNFTLIKARIKEKKYTLEDFKIVIDAACIKWRDDAKMKSFIRPETLFGSKFNQYLVEADMVLKASGGKSAAGSNNFHLNPQETANLID